LPKAPAGKQFPQGGSHKAISPGALAEKQFPRSNFPEAISGSHYPTAQATKRHELPNGMSYPTAPPLPTEGKSSPAPTPPEPQPLEPAATPLQKHKAFARSGIFLASCLEEAAFALLFIM
jgi:hypothetical protein